MKGLPIPFLYPSWIYYDEFHKTPCGVAVSSDGEKTHPRKLNAEQKKAVEEIRAVIRFYATARGYLPPPPEPIELSRRSGFGVKGGVGLLRLPYRG